MTRPPRQLVFQLDSGPAFDAANYLVTPSNEQAHSFLTGWPDWPSRSALLVGPHGSGKSHLTAIWSEQADAAIVDARRLTLAAVDEIEGAVAVENIDANGSQDKILFHLLNSAREKKFWLLLTASQVPNLIWPKLADLASRLRALPVAELFAPDDALVRAVLVKLFHDRQLAVDAEVVDYISRRMHRSLGVARDLVAALDEEALSLGRRVTRPIASEVMARFEEIEE